MAASPFISQGLTSRKSKRTESMISALPVRREALQWYQLTHGVQFTTSSL